MRHCPSFLLFAALLAHLGCSSSSPGPCDGLVYDDNGIPRDQYLPCARQIVAELDQVEQGLDAHYNRNDKDGRGEARSAIRRAGTLLRKAGGSQKMLARWTDRSLGALNVDLWNAYSSYEAAVMVRDNPRDFNNGRRAHGSARKRLAGLR